MAWPSYPASKYRAKSTVVGGERFDSKAESRVYQELQIRQRFGEITQLRRQTKWPLTVNGECVGVYIADAEYVVAATGEFIVLDVKGEHTRKLPVYRLKRRIFRAVWGFDITEDVRGRAGRAA